MTKEKLIEQVLLHVKKYIDLLMKGGKYSLSSYEQFSPYAGSAPLLDYAPGPPNFVNYLKRIEENINLYYNHPHLSVNELFRVISVDWHNCFKHFGGIEDFSIPHGDSLSELEAKVLNSKLTEEVNWISELINEIETNHLSKLKNE